MNFIIIFQRLLILSKKTLLKQVAVKLHVLDLCFTYCHSKNRCYLPVFYLYIYRVCFRVCFLLIYYFMCLFIVSVYISTGEKYPNTLKFTGKRKIKSTNYGSNLVPMMLIENLSKLIVFRF